MPDSSTTEPAPCTTEPPEQFTKAELQQLLAAAVRSGWNLSRKFPNHHSWEMKVLWDENGQPVLDLQPKHDLSLFE